MKTDDKDRLLPRKSNSKKKNWISASATFDKGVDNKSHATNFL